MHGPPDRQNLRFDFDDVSFTLLPPFSVVSFTDLETRISLWVLRFR